MPKELCRSIGGLALLLFLIVHPAGEVRPQGLSPKALDGLVDAVLKAHGGSKALGAVGGLKVVGRLTAVLRGEQGTSTIYFQHPDKLYSDHTYQKHREIRLLNGSKGWIKTGGRFEPVSPDVMLGMRYSLITYRLPLELVTQRKNLSYLGQVGQHGKRFDVLELTYSKALRVRVFLESESKRIAQVAGYLTVEGQTLVLSSVHGEYRKVADVAYPFHQLYFSGRTLIAEKRVEAVEANPRLPEGLFAPK